MAHRNNGSAGLYIALVLGLFLALGGIPAQAQVPVGVVITQGAARDANSFIRPGAVIGQVCPGDGFVLYQRIRVDESVLWLRIELLVAGTACSSQHIAVGTIAYVDSRLVQLDVAQVPAPAPNPEPGAPPAPTAAPAPQPTSAPVPTAVPAPTAVPPRDPSRCAPSYPTVCIPPPPPDLDCPEIRYQDFLVIYNVPDPDPHDFDRDRDGVGCET